MSSYAPLRSLNCPNCGAPLAFPKEHDSVVCRFCDSTIERSDEAPTPDDASHALKVDIFGGQVSVQRPSGGASGGRRFIIKMQGGQPLVFEAGDTASPGASLGATLTTTTVRPAQRRGGCVWVILALIIAATVLVPLVLSLAGSAGLGALLGLVTGGEGERILTQIPGVPEILTQVPQATTRYVVGGPAVLVPSMADAPADILALTTQYPASGGEGEQRLVAVSGAEPQLLWSSAPLDKDTYDTPLLANRDFVYAVSGARLLALRRADGQTAWTAPLADQIAMAVCQACLALDGDRLYALTDDGTLQAYDARTGAPVWKYAATQDSPRGLYLLSGRPAFMDQDDDGDGILRVFDPDTGAMQTAQPTCQTNFSEPDYTDWTTPLYLAPDGGSAYVVFGFFATCAQRLDAQTLEPVWAVKLPEGLDLNQRDVRPVFADDAVYFSAGTQIVALAAADGAAQTVLADEDYKLVPLAVDGGTLLVRAMRQRGSTRFELWAVDRASGERRWVYDLGEHPPLDPPDANTSIIDDDKPVWTWRLTSDGLYILRFKRAADDVSHALLVERLDLQTGVSAGQQEARLGVETIILSAPEVAGWTQDTLWFIIENSVLAFDLGDGAFTYRWP